ncbi:hypothetical protein EW146_g514 [Bondarzewia mesenterica]|uniref:F-box domain-containing protein n=1 Tax=Bondarzewia mesenterica TaxID=1095465 RepID=A0A4S4M6L5_9AGAM|nr:hypothetical protein EW146_g514 [Bondarzewia mesenterica]
MGMFNPKMLDASIRDVVSSLSNDHKTDVLLYAMERLPSNPGPLTRVLRNVDLQEILLLDPDHPEARALMPQAGSMETGEFSIRPHARPRFSPELWREIATYLSREDLRNLLFVPHSPSNIATQLLFRKLHLQFGTARYYASNPRDEDEMEQAHELDNWHAQRSADILTQVVSDPKYASLVRTLLISAPQGDENVLTTFQIGMFANALPKLVNLKTFVCTMGNEALTSILQIVEKSHPDIEDLRLVCTSETPATLPQLSQLISFTYVGSSIIPNTHAFVSDLVVTLRKISLDIPGTLPMGLISSTNFTTVDLAGIIEDTAFFTELLTEGHRLEVLRLRCSLGHNCTPSTAFRAQAAAPPLSSLRIFSLSIIGVSREFGDPDLFPAVASFVRGHSCLQELGLLKSQEVDDVGYDASVWGVLPSLVQLRSLAMHVPRDLAPALSTWLIPRTVRSLHLDMPLNQGMSQTVQAWTGLPRDVTFLSVTPSLTLEIQNLVYEKLPNVRLLRMQNVFYTVIRTDHGVVLDPWSGRRSRFYAHDWLEGLECEDPILWNAGTSYMNV